MSTDIIDRSQCDAVVAGALDRFGRVDGLINSAFISGGYARVEHADFDEWRKTMDTNLFGTLNMCRAVLPAMKEHGGGSIVNVNSMITRKPRTGEGGYAASKAALAAATATLANEWGRFGIRVNSTFMGWMWGSNVERYMESVAARGGPSVDEQKAAVAETIAIRRIPTDYECAKAVIAVLSDYSSAISGASIDVNGGEYMAM
jgi:NAD(P)-dependent dehydrogenase (short-subunit alcohol dehydrogenase family)